LLLNRWTEKSLSDELVALMQYCHIGHW